MPDGKTTRRAHAESVLKQTRRWPDDIPEEPAFPEALRYLWRWYEKISLGRGLGGFSLNPLMYSEVESWCRMNDVQMERWELEVIKDLDIAFLGSLRVEKAEEKRN